MPQDKGRVGQGSWGLPSKAPHPSLPSSPPPAPQPLGPGLAPSWLLPRTCANACPLPPGRGLGRRREGHSHSQSAWQDSRASLLAPISVPRHPVLLVLRVPGKGCV